MTKKHMKRSSMSLITRKMQNNTTMLYHPNYKKNQNKQKTKITSSGEHVEKLEPLNTAGIVKWCSCWGNSMEAPQNIKSVTSIWSAILLMVICPKELEAKYQRDTCIPCS